MFVCWKRQDHSQTNNLPDPKSQRRTGPDNLTTFTTLSCTMQTVHFMNCRLYLNLVQHLSVICLDMQMSYDTGLCIVKYAFFLFCFVFQREVCYLCFVLVKFCLHWESNCYSFFVIPLLSILQPPVAIICQ